MKPVGFFKPGDVPPRRLSLTTLREPGCNACGLYRGCQSPKMPVAGGGAKKILVIGEAPGEEEDRRNKPFVGKTGQLLQTALRRAGVNLFQDCWVTNSLRCRPRGNKLPKDPKPLIKHCLPNVLAAIRDHGPEVIILLGANAVQSVVGWLWKEDSKGMTAWAGWQIPSRRLNAWVVPTYHPSFIARGKFGGGPDVAEALFQSHIDAACALKGRPYEGVPDDFERAVRREQDPDRAADYVHRYIDAGRPIAFDYETDRLKPDHPDARIVCCAVSDGSTSVAYPWDGSAIKATKELLLRSPIVKVGWNARFEERWTRRAFGEGVNNWLMDGMLGAHVLDSRRGTKSLKFQAFVRLGAESYDEMVKPYLKAENGNAQNRIHEVRLDKLLLYNGLDALLEAKLGLLMAPQVGVKL